MHSLVKDLSHISRSAKSLAQLLTPMHSRSTTYSNNVGRLTVYNVLRIASPFSSKSADQRDG